MDLKFHQVGMPTQPSFANTDEGLRGGTIGFPDLLQNHPPLFWHSQFPIRVKAD